MEVNSPKMKPVANWLTEEELSAVADIARDLDLTYEGVLRQALRLYQKRHILLQHGFDMNFVNKEGQDFDAPSGCGNPE